MRAKIVPLHSAEPYPWHTHALIDPPAARIQRQRAQAWRILLIAAVLVIIGCGLAGLAHT